MNIVSRIFLFNALAMGLITGCGQNQEQKKELPVVEEPETPKLTEEKREIEDVETSEQVYSEVMEIHDRSMLQMGTIRQLSKQLKDSIKNTNANPMEQEEVINNYRNQLKELNNANQEMLQWMRQFDGAGEGLSEQEKLEYLKIEKEKINKVDRQVNEAISGAREVL